MDLTLQEQCRRQAAGASGLPSPTSSRNGQFAPHVWIWPDLESGGNNTSQAGGQHTFDSLWGRGRREACLQAAVCAIRLLLGFLGKASRRSGSGSPAPQCAPGFLLLGALRLHAAASAQQERVQQRLPQALPPTWICLAL